MNPLRRVQPRVPLVLWMAIGLAVLPGCSRRSAPPPGTQAVQAEQGVVVTLVEGQDKGHVASGCSAVARRRKIGGYALL